MVAGHVGFSVTVVGLCSVTVLVVGSGHLVVAVTVICSCLVTVVGL